MKKLLLIALLLTGCFNLNRVNILSFPEMISPKGAAIVELPREYKNGFYKTFKIIDDKIIQPYNGSYGIWHQIRAKDNIGAISKRYGLSANSIREANNLTGSSVIRYGDFLFIPFSKEKINSISRSVRVLFNPGSFMWPVFGRITSEFGIRHRKFHKGLDIAAPKGNIIFAAKDGIITYARRQKGYGYVVFIEHKDEYTSRYAHMCKMLVKEGESVSQGQVIGMVGKTGRSTGFHLHFEVRFKDEPFDPMLLLPQIPDEFVKIFAGDVGKVNQN